MPEKKNFQVGQIWETNQGYAVLIQEIDEDDPDDMCCCLSLEEQEVYDFWVDKDGMRDGKSRLFLETLLHPSILPEDVKHRVIHRADLRKNDIILHDGLLVVCRVGSGGTGDTVLLSLGVECEDVGDKYIHLYREAFPRLAVGQKWLTRCGYVVKVEEHDDTDDTFRVNGNWQWTCTDYGVDDDLIVLLKDENGNDVNINYWPWEPDVAQRDVKKYLDRNDIRVTYSTPLDCDGKPVLFPNRPVAHRLKWDIDQPKEATTNNPTAKDVTQTPTAKSAAQKPKRYPDGKVLKAGELLKGDFAMVLHHGVWVVGTTVLSDPRIGRTGADLWVINRGTGLCAALHQEDEVVLIRHHPLPVLLPMQRWTTRGGEHVILKPTDESVGLLPFHPAYEDQGFYFTHDPFCLEDEDWDLVLCSSEQKTLCDHPDLQAYSVDEHVILRTPRDEKYIILNTSQKEVLGQAFSKVASHLYGTPMSLIAQSLIKL